MVRVPTRLYGQASSFGQTGAARLPFNTKKKKKNQQCTHCTPMHTYRYRYVGMTKNKNYKYKSADSYFYSLII